MRDKKFLTKYNFLSQTIIFAHPALEQNFVGTASPRSSSFVPFADSGMREPDSVRFGSRKFTVIFIVMTISLITAGLIVIKDKQLLLAFSNNKQAFYLPGGKADPGETAVDAVIREVFEELNIELSPKQLRFYTHITAPAFGEQNGVVMEQDCYITEIKHEPTPSAEIGELRYFNTAAYQLQPHRPPGVVEVMRRLKQDGIID